MAENTDNDVLQHRFKKLGFKPQREKPYTILLPYADRLDNESLQILAGIKGNLGKAVLVRELRPGCELWTTRLSSYIKLYGLKFSKEDHIAFIQLMYELITIPDLEPYLVNKFGSLLIKLLKKKELLSPNELNLPWRPLYDLRKRITETLYTRLGMYKCSIKGSTCFNKLYSTLNTLVHAAKFYFPLSATQEILDELRPHLCPFSMSMFSTMIKLQLFLPFALPPDKSHLGHQLWFEEMMKLWEIFHNATLWEIDIMRLMARLAHHNIGYINWDPYVPVMFSRIFRSFNLPVAYKQEQNVRRNYLDIGDSALWIVSALGANSTVQMHLDKLIKSLESYFHPENRGIWTDKLEKLVSKLTLYFIERLHRERYEKSSWQTPIPESHKLTDDDVTKFVGSIQSVANQTLLSLMGDIFTNNALLHLATIRPDMIIPSVLQKLYSTLESVTEPYKLMTAMDCVTSVARPMVQGKLFKEGPTHVIPLLVRTLSGIDSNDISIFMCTCRFIDMFISMIPLIDSSKASNYWNDLSEEEQAVCSATANFEDLVMQFLDCIFVLIDRSETGDTQPEFKTDKNGLEDLCETTLLGTCKGVLYQSSPVIFESALNKFQLFVTGRILGTSIAGHLVATMCKAFVQSNAEKTLAVLLPKICGIILSLTDSKDILKEENLNEELLFNLLLLSRCVVCEGKYLITYGQQLIKILDRTLQLVSTEGYHLAGDILKYLLQVFTNMSSPPLLNAPEVFHKPISEYLSIRDWGKPSDFEGMKLNWYVPGVEEIGYVQQIVSKYLPYEIKRLLKFVRDEEKLTSDELQRSLSIVLNTFGCGMLLPLWDEELIVLVESCVPLEYSHHTVGFEHAWITMPDGSNIRKTVSDCMNLLLNKLLSCKEDDTRCLLIITDIYEYILFARSKQLNVKYKDLQRYNVLKHTFEDKLIGNKKHLRPVMIYRSWLQLKLILMNLETDSITPTHKEIMLNLYKLCTSRYSKVRSKAQQVLFSAINHFPFSYLIIIPQIVNSLKQENNPSDEELTGALYSLTGPEKHPLIIRRDWERVASVWNAIIQAPISSKPSVINLFKAIEKLVCNRFSTINIEIEIPDRCLEAAKCLWNESFPVPSILVPSQMDVADGLVKLQERNKKNKKTYLDLLDSLLEVTDKRNLPWIYRKVGFSLLKNLVRPDISYPPNVVRLFLNTLKDESFEIRNIALHVTTFILQQQKRPHKKDKIDIHNFSSHDRNQTNQLAYAGEVPGNTFMQYNSERCPKTADEWDKRHFLHKNFYGYYCWPKQLEVHAPVNDQPNLDRTWDELNDVEKEIQFFFVNQENVDKLMMYYALGENEYLDRSKILMFKGLFRNHGDEYLMYFKPHLERLIKENNKNSQRCGIELIAGFIRGSKHWPFEKLKSLREFLSTMIRTALTNMTTETVAMWVECFGYVSNNRDPNHNQWLFDILIEQPSRDEPAFITCGRLRSLQCVVSNRWKIAGLLHRLLASLIPYLAHPLQNIRETIGSILMVIFSPDIGNFREVHAVTPHISDFMSDIVPKLEILYQSNSEFRPTSFKDKTILQNENSSGKMSEIKGSFKNVETQQVSSDAKEVSIRLLKTLCSWITKSINCNLYSIVPEFYELFPLICLMETYEADEELCKHCSDLIGCLAQAFTSTKYIPVVLSSVCTVATNDSWLARSTSLSFLEVFVFYNLPVILSEEKWTKQIIDLVLKLLEDERVEVREKAAEVLGGLLHCDFISRPTQLLDLFKLKLKKTLTMSRSDSNNINYLITRHSGVLGLCAFINAHPYDVPEFLPEIFAVLESHVNDPPPIPSSIRKIVCEFKRTHHSNWEEQKKMFSEDELAILSDLLVPSTYIT